MLQSIFKKIAIYSLIYIIVTLVLSPEEIYCIIKLDFMCFMSLITKWLIFLVIMYLYDRLIKPLFQKKIDKQ